MVRYSYQSVQLKIVQEGLIESQEKAQLSWVNHQFHRLLDQHQRVSLMATDKPHQARLGIIRHHH